MEDFNFIIIPLSIFVKLKILECLRLCKEGKELFVGLSRVLGLKVPP
jgi:hypothetical protein